MPSLQCMYTDRCSGWQFFLLYGCAVVHYVYQICETRECWENSDWAQTKRVLFLMHLHQPLQSKCVCVFDCDWKMLTVNVYLSFWYWNNHIIPISLCQCMFCNGQWSEKAENYRWTKWEISKSVDQCLVVYQDKYKWKELILLSVIALSNNKYNATKQDKHGGSAL